MRAAVLSHRPDVAESDLGTARQLREVVYQTLTATIDGRAVSREDRGVLNAAARVAPPVPALAADGNLERGGMVTAGLSALARDCLELLTGPEGDLLRRCAGAACTRIFIDRSRGNTRRWCEMAGCGDRAKAAAYRDRLNTR